MRIRIATLVTAVAVIGGAVLVPAASASAATAAADDAYTVGAAAPFATPAGRGLLANDADVPGGAVVQLLIQPQHGKIRALDTASGAFTYQPDDAFAGTDLFTYCIQLGRGCVTDPATVALNVVPHLERVAGGDRFEQAVAVSASRFAPGVNTVLIASGSVFPDALSGGAASVAFGGPVLLVAKDSIPSSVQNELRRLTPNRIVVLGGLATVGADVEAALRDYTLHVDRIGGADRYEVSAGVSAVFGPDRPVVYVASGEVFPDALSASAAAGFQLGPVLLVTKGSVPASVASALGRLKPARIVVLGGANTVSDAVVATLGGVAPTTRIAGSDRYAVSAATSASTFDPATARVVYIASGEVFPDALSGSPAAIQQHAPVLLVGKSSISRDVATELTRLHPNRIVVLGGLNTISAQVESELTGYLAR